MEHGIRSLAKQTAIYGLGDALYKAVAFVLIPIYLKYLAPAQYGAVESLMVTKGIMVTLIGMGLPIAVFRFYYRVADENERKTIVSTIFFISLFVQTLMGIVLLWQNKLVASLVVNNPEFGFLFAVLAVNIFLEGFRGIPLSVFRAKNQALGYTVINFTVAMTTLIMNIFFVANLGKGVLGVILGNLCGGIVGVIMVFPKILKEIKCTFELHLIRRIVTFAVPLGFSSLPLILILMADRFFIVRLASLHDLGLYALAYKFGSIMYVFVVMPFALAWAPFVFDTEKRSHNAPRIFSQATNWFVVGGLSLVVTISVFSTDVVRFISTRTEYYPAVRVVSAISYAFFFFGLSSQFRTGILLSGRTHLISTIMISCLCVNLCLNLVLIKTFGCAGAAYSLLLTFLFGATISFLISSRVYRIDYNIGKMFAMIALSVLVIAPTQIVQLGSHLLGIFMRMLIVASFIVCIYWWGLSDKEKVAARGFLIRNINMCFARKRLWVL